MSQLAYEAGGLMQESGFIYRFCETMARRQHVPGGNGKKQVTGGQEHKSTVNMVKLQTTLWQVTGKIELMKEEVAGRKWRYER